MCFAFLIKPSNALARTPFPNATPPRLRNFGEVTPDVRPSTSV